MAQITYENKVKINDNPNIPDINKVTDADMNEIKNVVNENYQEQQEIKKNIDELKPTILYENSEGVFEDFECSEELSNYDYLRITFTHQNMHGTTIVPTISPFVVSCVEWANSTTVQLGFASYNIDGKFIKFNNGGYLNFSNASVSNQKNINQIRINKVEGLGAC